MFWHGQKHTLPVAGGLTCRAGRTPRWTAVFLGLCFQGKCTFMAWLLNFRKSQNDALYVVFDTKCSF